MKTKSGHNYFFGSIPEMPLKRRKSMPYTVQYFPNNHYIIGDEEYGNKLVDITVDNSLAEKLGETTTEFMIDEIKEIVLKYYNRDENA